MELPLAFTDRTKNLLKDEYPAFEKALREESPISIRLNPLKTNSGLSGQEQVPWCKNGFYQQDRSAFTFDPRFHAGAYYVQEASSMFLDHVIRQHITRPVRYLDLCAAPGGKTTLALSALPAGSLVVCNEIVRNRAHVLAENIIKWGNPYCIVTNNDSATFNSLKHYFDVILTDVPCSGEGMFRKDPVAVQEWSASNVGLCSERQKEILHNIWDALRPGGILIYSTCTYNTDENELIADYIQNRLGATPLPVKTDPEWGIHKELTGTVPCYRFMPHVTKGEGLFMTVFRKSESEDIIPRERLQNRISAKKNKNRNGCSIPDNIRSWIRNNEKFFFSSNANSIFAFPSEYSEDLPLFESRTNVIHAGIPLAYAKGKDYIPEHALALSTFLNRNIFPEEELPLNTALSYLRRESFQLQSNERDYFLLTFEGMPLGWAKNLGNRANNLYPQEWRIRSGYTPTQPLPIAFK